jgi:hypothetical protein
MNESPDCSLGSYVHSVFLKFEYETILVIPAKAGIHAMYPVALNYGFPLSRE